MVLRTCCSNASKLAVLSIRVRTTRVLTKQPTTSSSAGSSRPATRIEEFAITRHGRKEAVVISLVGLKAPANLASLDPDRINLLRAYDGLNNPHLQRTLAAIGQLLLQDEHV